ncbi:SMP-30/gluconolactonase/LRE family protein [Halomonas sp. ML-15]|uniref:SMP-30/gluconolactonase/LRE family protein n=1 Tax=Halomonas sp. ML-15 TaxID=2773305 RepID=UPI001745C6EA|nr:SMP-30/gluconolactonase/LRE family protein [Halomonas sp. ML-15]MBD3896858.1 SMP-30/gluconolactonase/LRE family protein [Halomonas sp. ML-15]
MSVPTHSAELAVDSRCALGEGPQWHAAEGKLFWCDITQGRLHWLDPASGHSAYLEVGHMLSLAAPLEEGGVLLVGEKRLSRFDPTRAALETLCDFEADNPITRSNDARVDRHGSLWLSSMGKSAEAGAGSLYRLHRGELVRLRSGLTIPNALCFTPGGEFAFFTDTPTGRVMRWPLDADGWPLGEPTPWADFSAHPGNPDGAVIDAEGHLWLALWGAGMVVRLDPAGRVVSEVTLTISQPSCPAFAGAALERLYITTAREGLGAADLSQQPHAGGLFMAEVGVSGLAEPPLKLS